MLLKAKSGSSNTVKMLLWSLKLLLEDLPWSLPWKHSGGGLAPLEGENRRPFMSLKQASYCEVYKQEAFQPQGCLVREGWNAKV